MTNDPVPVKTLQEAIVKVRQMIVIDGPIHDVLLARLQTKLAARLKAERDLKCSTDNA